MRTTLDIDPRVLAVARARVRAGVNKTIGEAVSELALSGVDAAAPASVPAADGIVLLRSVPGHVITDEMVAEAMIDD